MTGTNMFKPGNFIYPFLCTEYNLTESVRYKFSSLVLSLFPMKEKNLVLVLIILILRRKNGAVVRMPASHQ